MAPDRDESIAFERRVILAALYDPGFRSYCLSNLEAEYFQDQACHVIYRHMRALFSRDEIVSFGSVVQEVLDDPRLDDKKAREFVSFIEPHVDEPDVRLLEAAFSSVLPKIKREIATRLVQAALISATDLAAEGDYRAVFRLFREVEQQSLFSEAVELDFWEYDGPPEIDDQVDHIPTFIEGRDPQGNEVSLDSLLYHRGLGRGQLMIIVGKAKLGKTTAMMNLAMNMMLSGFNVQYYTLEMEPSYLILRSLSAYSGIPTQKIRTPREVKKIRKRLHLDYPDHGTIVFYEYPTGKLKPDMISQNVASIRQGEGVVDAVFVDYVDLMSFPEGIRNEWSAMGLNSQHLRGIAVEHDLAMITASQFGKSGLDKQDLGGSEIYGAVSKIFAADIVGFLNESERQVQVRPGSTVTKREISFTLGYARYGRGGVKIILDADREIGRIFPMIGKDKFKE